MARNFAVSWRLFLTSQTHKKDIEYRKKEIVTGERRRHFFDITIWREDIGISFLTGISDTLLDTSLKSNKIPDRNVTMSDI